MSYVPSEGGRDRHPARAAIFVDYEDLYRTLSASARRNGEVGSLISEMIEALKRSLLEERETQTAVSQAYADFTELNGKGDALQRALYLQGVESRFVPQSLQANAVEIQLCVDAMDLLHHRSDIDTFVLLTGSRSYLPLIQHFKRYGRRVLIVGLEEPPSLDLHAESQWVFDGRDLLSTSGRRVLSTSDGGRNVPATLHTDGVDSADFETVDDPVLIRGLEIIEEYFGQYDEVYLTPLLRKMSELLDERTCDPKAIISDLEDLHAVRLEKRQGFPHDYTVLIVERDHPDVQRVQQELADNEPYYYDDVDSSYDGDDGDDDVDDDFYVISSDGRDDADDDFDRVSFDGRDDDAVDDLDRLSSDGRDDYDAADPAAPMSGSDYRRDEGARADDHALDLPTDGFERDFEDDEFGDLDMQRSPSQR